MAGLLEVKELEGAEYLTNGVSNVRYVAVSRGRLEFEFLGVNVMKSIKSPWLILGIGLALSLFHAPATATEYSDAVLADNPAMYWSFDSLNESGNVSEMVSGLAANQLTPTNAPLIDHDAIRSGLSLGMAADMVSFNKATYFAPDLSPTSPLQNAYAIEFWGKFLNNNFSYIMNLGAGSPYPGDQPGLVRSWTKGSGFGGIDLEGLSAGKTLGSPKILDINWHHYALIVYGAADSSWGVAPRTEIMIDGGAPVSITNDYSGKLNWQGPAAVGAAFAPNVHPSGWTFNPVGYLDEVAIYDLGGKSLSEIEAFRGNLAAHYLNFPPIDWPGDANGDDFIDSTDAAILAANWLTKTGATWSMGDFSGDGAVNDIDAAILAANWYDGDDESQSVPEPSIITILFSLCLPALLSLLKYKQKRA